MSAELRSIAYSLAALAAVQTCANAADREAAYELARVLAEQARALLGEDKP